MIDSLSYEDKDGTGEADSGVEVEVRDLVVDGANADAYSLESNIDRFIFVGPVDGFGSFQYRVILI